MGTTSNINQPPHTSWMKNEQVLDIDNPLLRDIVAHVLDQLEDGPRAVYTFEYSLYMESTLTRAELIEQVKHTLQTIAHVEPSEVNLSSLQADDTIRLTFLRK